eukprot:g1520.t1
MNYFVAAAHLDGVYALAPDAKQVWTVYDYNATCAADPKCANPWSTYAADTGGTFGSGNQPQGMAWDHRSGDVFISTFAATILRVDPATKQFKQIVKLTTGVAAGMDVHPTDACLYAVNKAYHPATGGAAVWKFCPPDFNTQSVIDSTKAFDTPQDLAFDAQGTMYITQPLNTQAGGGGNNVLRIKPVGSVYSNVETFWSLAHELEKEAVSQPPAPTPTTSVGYVGVDSHQRVYVSLTNQSLMQFISSDSLPAKGHEFFHGAGAEGHTYVGINTYSYKDNILLASSFSVAKLTTLTATGPPWPPQIKVSKNDTNSITISYSLADNGGCGLRNVSVVARWNSSATTQKQSTFVVPIDASKSVTPPITGTVEIGNATHPLQSCMPYDFVLTVANAPFGSSNPSNTLRVLPKPPTATKPPVKVGQPQCSATAAATIQLTLTPPESDCNIINYEVTDKASQKKWNCATGGSAASVPLMCVDGAWEKMEKAADQNFERGVAEVVGTQLKEAEERGYQAPRRTKTLPLSLPLPRGEKGSGGRSTAISRRLGESAGATAGAAGGSSSSGRGSGSGSGSWWESMWHAPMHFSLFMAPTPRAPQAGVALKLTELEVGTKYQLGVAACSGIGCGKMSPYDQPVTACTSPAPITPSGTPTVDKKTTQKCIIDIIFQVGDTGSCGLTEARVVAHDGPETKPTIDILRSEWKSTNPPTNTIFTIAYDSGLESQHTYKFDVSFGHLLRCVYPTHLAHAAAQFDREYLLALLRVADAEWVFDGEHGGHFPCLERIVGVGSFTERGGGFSTLVRGGAAAHSRLGRELLAHATECVTQAVGDYHAQLRGASAATWFLASDVCTRQSLTCLPGGDTALDNATFVTMVNCSVGGVAPQLRDKVGKVVAVPRRTGPHVGAARDDKGLGLPLDALATNLLNADVGGAGGGFGLRHDRFRDSLLMEARRAKFSVDKEFEVGVDRGALSAAHATTLRGAAAAEALRESGDVPDGLTTTWAGWKSRVRTCDGEDARSGVGSLALTTL